MVYESYIFISLFEEYLQAVLTIHAISEFNLHFITQIFLLKLPQMGNINKILFLNNFCINAYYYLVIYLK